MKTLKVVIDNKESEKTIKSSKKFFEKEGFKTKVKSMPVGDYRCGNCVIEHKEFNDYYNSVRSRRVFDQATNMAYNFKNGCVVIVGSNAQFKKSMYFMKKKITFTNASYFGSVASIMIDEDKRVHCWQVENQNQMFEFMKAFFIRGNTERPAYKKVKRIQPVSEDIHISQIACIPKIGPKKAYDIAQIFKNARELCDASVEDICTVDGIGKGNATLIKKWYPCG